MFNIKKKAQPKEKKLGPIKPYAIWLISRQEYSCKTIEQKFKQKGYPEDEIKSCLEFLQEHSFVSDDRYAENRARAKSRLHGNRRIAMDLRQKGIADETISETVESLDDENTRAIHVSRKFAGKEITQDLKAKIWRFLMARGFGSNAIKAAMNDLQGKSSEAQSLEGQQD